MLELGQATGSVEAYTLVRALATKVLKRRLVQLVKELVGVHLLALSLV